jgi:hypothetical protein
MSKGGVPADEVARLERDRSTQENFVGCGRAPYQTWEMNKRMSPSQICLSSVCSTESNRSEAEIDGGLIESIEQLVVRDQKRSQQAFGGGGSVCAYCQGCSLRLTRS